MTKVKKLKARLLKLKKYKKIEEIKEHLLYTGTSDHGSPQVPLYFQTHNVEPTY